MSATEILKLMKGTVVLEKSTYSKWSSQFSDVLSLLDVVEYIDTVIPELGKSADSSTEKKVRKQDQNVRIAMSRLVPDAASHVIGPNYTARECWINIKEFYCPNPSNDIDDLLQEFWGLTVEDEIEVDDFVQQLTTIRGKISILDSAQKPSESSMKKRILSHFQSCCNGFYLSIVIPLKDPAITFPSAVNSIRSSQITYRELHPSPMIALAGNQREEENSTSQNQKVPRICAYCNQKNHVRERCFLWIETPDGTKWAAKNPQKAAITRKLQQRYRKANSKEKAKNHNNEEGSVGCVWIAEDSSAAFNCVSKPGDIILDTGATNHIFHDRSLFTCMSASNKSVYTASGASIPVSGIGDICFNVYDYSNRNKSKIIKVENVWYVPSCTKNLLSGTQLVSKGFELRSSNGKLSVISREGNIVATATPRGGLFCFNTSPLYYSSSTSPSDFSEQNINTFLSENKQSVTKLIHHRFAHVGPKIIDDINVGSLGIPHSRSGDLSKFKIDKEELSVCDVCNTCKQVEKINRAPVPRSQEILDLIHSDTWGKCRVAGIYGSLYFVTFTDDASRESEVCLLKTTKDVPDKFEWYKNKKELKSGRKIKAMRFDGGTEYKRIKFNGITQQFNAPYTQHQNV